MTACVWCGHGEWRTEHASFCPTVDASWLPFLSPIVAPDPTCTIDGCDGPHKAKGLCNKHYQRSLRAEASAA